MLKPFCDKNAKMECNAQHGNEQTNAIQQDTHESQTKTKEK